jgi:hypothetical protein
MSPDTAIFLTVMTLRLVVPLAIPRFPLPGVLASLILDGLDQGIFSGFTNLDLTNYQSYDKALDVYYLTIAYLSTMRNWSNLEAVHAARFLLYFRLVGAMLFELSGVRPLLLVFPNTFEYFFIFYQVVALRWDPERLHRGLIYGSIAFIWLFIKLPQEYWIHVAQKDATDFLLDHPILIVLLAVLILVLVVGLRWAMVHRLPPADTTFTLDAGVAPRDSMYEEGVRWMASGRFIDHELVEKIALVSLVSIIFSQMLPNVETTPLAMAIGVTVLVTSNTAISEWIARRGRGWGSALRQFISMAVLNIGLTITFLWIIPMELTRMSAQTTLFFLLLITLIITLYDMYRPKYLVRAGIHLDVQDNNDSPGQS